MATQVSVFQPLGGEPAIVLQLFLAEPTWLPDARRVEGGRWTMLLHGSGLSRRVTARIGEPWSTGSTAWRSLSWEPTEVADGAAPGRLGDRFLPTFEGELAVHAADATSLVLDGHYQPPGGRLGATLDDIALHRIARSTTQRLLADIARSLGERLEAIDVGPPRPGEG